MAKITVSISTVDGVGITRSFKTDKGAKRFAQRYAGDKADIGRGYAISYDGIVKVRLNWSDSPTIKTVADLFG